MAAKSRARSQDFSRRFWSVLSYACCECCLIILLLVAAVLSYLATRFARICKLRAPCMVCSKLDHVLHGKAWFSGDLVCAAHRLEISCLSYCQSHNKLVHSDDLCKSCLLSSTAIVGKPGECKSFNVKEEVNSRSRSRRTTLCSCCSEPFKKACNAHRLAEIENVRVPDDEMSKRKESNVSMASVCHSADNSFDHLPDGGYRKLKVGSDSDSEIPISDEDKKEMRSHGAQLEPVTTTARGLSMPASEDIVLGKSIHPTPLVPLNTVTGTDNQPNGSKSSNAAASSASAIGHGLEEINWSQVDVTSNLATPSEAIPDQVPAELPKEKTFLVGIEEVGDSEAIKDVGSANAGTVKPVHTGTGPSARILMDRNNSLKNAFVGRGNVQSPRLSEIISARDNSRTQEDVKSLLSQMSSACGFDGPWSEMAPSTRISMQIDESKLSDATSKRASLSRNSSMLELFDVKLVSEVEGESSVDHLKRQVELDKKSMSILYKELEAERSASAVAASEAMAMINRLQEEKAAMQMEALQYLRMMEEQAEYDQEAIQKLNDLLTEREKEILDMEAELDNYRSRLGSSVREDSPNQRNMTSEGLNGSDFVKNTMSDFEDEKAYILEYLSRLETKLGMSSTNRLASDDVKNKRENGALGDHHATGSGQHIENSENSHSRGEVESENGSLPPSPRKHSNGESISVQQTEVTQSVEESREENGSCSNSDDDRHQPDSKMSDMTSIKDEILLLNTRLKALEADQKFLEQILSSLKCSSGGVQCVLEITSHLREIRRTVTERRDIAVI